MADEKDKSQQTEEPTAKRLAEAHEHGDVVKSQEVSTFIVLAGGTLAIALFGRSAALGLASMLRMFLEQPDRIEVSGAMLKSLVLNTAAILAPFFILM